MSNVLYISDSSNVVLREVDNSSIISTPVITSSDTLWQGPNYFPLGIVGDSSGANLYVADEGNEVVWQINTTTMIATRIAGVGGFASYTGNGSALGAKLGDIADVAVDTAGNVYISDPGDNYILAVNTQGTTQTLLGVSIAAGDVAIVAGNGSASTSAPPPPPNGVSALSVPLTAYGIVVNAAGDLFYADQLGDCICRVDHSTGIVTTVAGDGSGGAPTDGLATTSNVLVPACIRLDAAENIYIGESTGLSPGNDGGLVACVNTQGTTQTILGVSIPAGFIKIVAGTFANGYSGDGGPAIAAVMSGQFSGAGILAITLDASGNLYIADSTQESSFGGPYGRVRMVNTSGIINTIAGTGTPGYSGDGGPATSGKISDGVFGLAFAAAPAPPLTGCGGLIQAVGNPLLPTSAI